MCLLQLCQGGEVEFTAPYASASPATHCSVEGYARCKSGGRPETGIDTIHSVKAGAVIRHSPFGMFVVTASWTRHEGFKVTYINEDPLSRQAPHPSVILGTATLSDAARLR